MSEENTYDKKKNLTEGNNERRKIMHDIKIGKKTEKMREREKERW